MIAEQIMNRLCAHIRNYFTDDGITERGDFTISDGIIDLPFLRPGQWFRVMGSRFNDGVHQYPGGELTDETFSGIVWEMLPPAEFLDLAKDIETWLSQYEDAVKAPYVSENVQGVYSYKRQDGFDWRLVFRQRLNRYRRL